MTDTPPTPPRVADTSKGRAARRASWATYARRRHRVWAEEMRRCGVIIQFPENYSGRPLDWGDEDA